MTDQPMMWTMESEYALVCVRACPSGGFAAAVYLIDPVLDVDADNPVFRFTKMLALGFGETKRAALDDAISKFADDYVWNDPRAQQTLQTLRAAKFEE